ncbi:hypothetical protein Pcinc_018207 [Petrolisthes cinctipes]|uniref:Uncharacterized protein n=1 Tax=Petrolisthes cinctipes TaxID=88211 RepID=A0AAE1BE81_PETCI|nr:hypothetical protein Pcinc_044240 [Petrolisthes cinctipes]KAK3877048.1 hypothetical protein Pcinc_018207 [Petrolisthes cinctipes]
MHEGGRREVGGVVEEWGGVVERGGAWGGEGRVGAQTQKCRRTFSRAGLCRTSVWCSRAPQPQVTSDARDAQPSRHVGPHGTLNGCRRSCVISPCCNIKRVSGIRSGC